jgi:hypothetical protein
MAMTGNPHYQIRMALKFGNQLAELLHLEDQPTAHF